MAGSGNPVPDSGSYVPASGYHVPASGNLVPAIGNLVPAYLFCIAEEHIDSALAGTLNSLTPIFVIITGAVFFRLKTSTNHVIGILIAMTGSFLLLLSKGNMKENQHLVYIAMIILATIFYGYKYQRCQIKFSAAKKYFHLKSTILLKNYH